MVMPTNFNITLNSLYTIPSSLRLNSLCQVPQAQLDEFNANTNGKYVVASPNRRDNFDCPTSETCEGWAVSGISEACVGKKNTVVSADCITNMYNQIDASIQQSMQMSEDYTDQVVANAINGVQQTLTNTVTTLQETFNSQLSAQEQTLTNAIVDTATVVTANYKKDIASLATDTSNKMSSLQSSLSRRLSNVASALTSQIQDVVADTNNRFTYMSTHLEEFIDIYNNNNMQTIDTQGNIMNSIQQLVTQVERLSRMESQGVDVSAILAQWQSMDQTNVFQDLAINNTYKYASSGIVGVYDSTQLDIAYPNYKAVVNNTVYRCYEAGTTNTDINANPANVAPMAFYVRSGNPITSADVSVYDYVYRQVQSSCPSMLSSLATFLSLQGVTRIAIGTAPSYGILISAPGGSYTFDIGQCSAAINNIPNTTVPYSIIKTFADSGRYVLLRSNGIFDMSTVTANTLTISGMTKSAGEFMKAASVSIAGGSAVSIDGLRTKYNSITYGNGHFTINHPVYSTMSIHRCAPIISAPVVYQDMSGNSQVLANTDGNGRVLDDATSAGNAGLLIVDSAGAIGSTAAMLVYSNTNISVLVPNSYYYSDDTWCCDVNANPVQTVNSSYQCSLLGYNVCDTALFGRCLRSGAVSVVKLIGNNCPQGYTTQPISIMLRYKSPRMFFCTTNYKFAEPYGIQLSACARGSIRLPGAGVTMETGIMAPGGLYPASCIFWNSVSGNVPVYTISAEFDKQVVPTIINNLHGKKIAYYYNDGMVIDEMDRLYGIQNAGYDCLAYEMDKVIHDPKACVSYDMPSYSTTAYFAGKVRTTGLSALGDYFDISIVPSTNTSVGLTVNFALKGGIDYETAYVDNNNQCPSLLVDYSKDGTSCILRGWSTVYKAGFVVNVAGRDVCDGKSACITSLQVSDGTALLVSISDNGRVTNCSRFVCSAATRTFVAYAVDSFSMLLSRPNQLQYIDGIGNQSFYTDVSSRLDDITTAVAQAMASVSEINTTVSINYTKLYMDDIVSNIKQDYAAIKNDTAMRLGTLQLNITDTFDQIRAENAELRRQMDELIKNFTIGKPEFTESSGSSSSIGSWGWGTNMASKAVMMISIIALALSIVAILPCVLRFIGARFRPPVALPDIRTEAL